MKSKTTTCSTAIRRCEREHFKTEQDQHAAFYIINYTLMEIQTSKSVKYRFQKRLIEIQQAPDLMSKLLNSDDNEIIY